MCSWALVNQLPVIAHSLKDKQRSYGDIVNSICTLKEVKSVKSVWPLLTATELINLTVFLMYPVLLLQHHKRVYTNLHLVWQSFCSSYILDPCFALLWHGCPLNGSLLIYLYAYGKYVHLWWMALAPSVAEGLQQNLLWVSQRTASTHRAR